MNNKILLLSTGIVLMPFGLQAKRSMPKNKSKKNIIIFMTDDQSNKSIHALGNLDKITPNIDKLVKNGVSFMDHYATTSISMASRACLMTGMYEYKTGCNFQHGSLSQEQFKKSYPVLLRNAGYYTGFAGKFGFAVTKDGNDDCELHTYDVLPVNEFDEWAGGVDQTFYPTKANKYIAKYAKEYPHSTRAYGQFGVDFIDHAVEKDKPFVLSIYFKAPHRPLTPDHTFDNVYRGHTFNKVETYGRAYGTTLPKQAKLGREYMTFFDMIDKNYQEYQKKYNQLIYGVDYAIGMVIEELKKQGILDNTIIIFTADNGWNFGAHALSGKVLPYYEASNVPLIIYDPGNEENKGTRITSLTGNIDVTKTIMDYAGVKPAKVMDGVSLRPLVEHKKSKVRNDLALINVWGTPQIYSLSIVTQQYKYIYWYFGDKMKPKEELYDVLHDKNELNDISSLPEYAGVMKDMRRRYDKRLAIWKKENVHRNYYNEFSTIFDRHISWEQKNKLVPQEIWDVYDQEVRKSHFKGDTRDYDAVINYVEQK